MKTLNQEYGKFIVNCCICNKDFSNSLSYGSINELSGDNYFEHIEEKKFAIFYCKNCKKLLCNYCKNKCDQNNHVIFFIDDMR